jgi:hypothetical protein
MEIGTLDKLTLIKEILLNNDFNQLAPFLKDIKEYHNYIIQKYILEESNCEKHNPVFFIIKYVLEGKIEELDKICKKLSETTNSIIKIIND